MWISPKYAVYVRKIMDQVNNRVQATTNPQANETIEEHADIEIQQIIRELKQQNEDKDIQIQQLKPRVVPQDKENDYILALQLIEEKEDTIIYQFH
ncbi:MAG: hypothetical protein EZS28_008509 [Streblomastix strix]|uniref:KilA-N domain-containing protein n=1 Tax=Streblomastix strix TaxID=222440 RepID=A0A5J4WMA2_9EUKA|nr:MAG: hypothetical protein EZS28_008509 [Streblomastix strix]